MHYQPREINDDFSLLVYNSVLEGLDNRRVIFSKDDIEELSKYKYQIDDEILNGNCFFVELTSDIYDKKLQFLDSLFVSFGKLLFDFTCKDSISFVKEPEFLEQSKLITRWKRIFKLRILEKAYINSDSSLIDEAKLQKIITEIIQSESCHLKVKYHDAECVRKIYLNAIAGAFDPHTNYFDIDEKNAFNDAISENETSFGLKVIKNRQDKFEITNIIPGGPAWKSDTINLKDIILSVESKGEIYDFHCMSQSDVYKLLVVENIDSALFRIKKTKRKNYRNCIIKGRNSK